MCSGCSLSPFCCFYSLEHRPRVIADAGLTLMSTPCSSMRAPAMMGCSQSRALYTRPRMEQDMWNRTLATLMTSPVPLLPQPTSTPVPPDLTTAFVPCAGQSSQVSAQGSAAHAHVSGSTDSTAFSWTTCLGCVVALTLQQHPSSTPSTDWALTSLQNNVFRALMQCSVAASSLQATLDEVHRRLQLEGCTPEDASILTSTLHRWYVTGALPSESDGHARDGGGMARQ